MLSHSAHRPDGDTAIVTPPAEIDMTNVDQLRDELNAVLDRGMTTVIVDMTRTTFCDSAGSRALVLAHRRASGMNTDLRFVITQQPVRRVFELLGVNELIHVYTSLASAENDPAEEGHTAGVAPLPLSCNSGSDPQHVSAG